MGVRARTPRRAAASGSPRRERRRQRVAFLEVDLEPRVVRGDAVVHELPPHRRDDIGQRRVVDQVAAYKGPAGIKTFEPDMLMSAKNHNSTVLRGIVADAARPGPDYTRHSRMDRFIMRHLLHFPRTSPHFVSYSVNDLPSPGPSFLKTMFKTPIMAWTVRTPGQWEVAKRFADQMVFEGFDPDQN